MTTLQDVGDISDNRENDEDGLIRRENANNITNNVVTENEGYVSNCQDERNSEKRPEKCLDNSWNQEGPGSLHCPHTHLCIVTNGNIHLFGITRICDVVIGDECLISSSLYGSSLKSVIGEDFEYMQNTEINTENNENKYVGFYSEMEGEELYGNLPFLSIMNGVLYVSLLIPFEKENSSKENPYKKAIFENSGSGGNGFKIDEKYLLSQPYRITSEKVPYILSCEILNANSRKTLGTHTLLKNNEISNNFAMDVENFDMSLNYPANNNKKTADMEIEVEKSSVTDTASKATTLFYSEKNCPVGDNLCNMNSIETNYDSNDNNDNNDTTQLDDNTANSDEYMYWSLDDNKNDNDTKNTHTEKDSYDTKDKNRNSVDENNESEKNQIIDITGLKLTLYDEVEDCEEIHLLHHPPMNGVLKDVVCVLRSMCGFHTTSSTSISPSRNTRNYQSNDHTDIANNESNISSINNRNNSNSCNNNESDTNNTHSEIQYVMSCLERTVKNEKMYSQTIQTLDLEILQIVSLINLLENSSSGR